MTEEKMQEEKRRVASDESQQKAEKSIRTNECTLRK
jgi:hypothetical protein